MRVTITRDKYDAVLFDLDGVITDTANIHAACWKQMFDTYLQQRAAKRGEPCRPFEIATDYRLYVDRRPRFDGVRDFLTARGIQLPESSPDDPIGARIRGSEGQLVALKPRSGFPLSRGSSTLKRGEIRL